MRINTRTETINGYTYCAYCGKELKNPNYGTCPEPLTICNCEKAKQELELYDKLKELYNAPLADSLIEMKVDQYRNMLLGKHQPTTSLGITTPLVPISYLDKYCSTTECTKIATEHKGEISYE